MFMVWLYQLFRSTGKGWGETETCLLLRRVKSETTYTVGCVIPGGVCGRKTPAEPDLLGRKNGPSHDMTARHATIIWSAGFYFGSFSVS